MAFKQPPEVNGLCEFCTEPIDEMMILDIQAKLKAIQDAFVPSEDQPVISTHYLVSEYNASNPDCLINGDSAQFILAYAPATEEA